MYNVRPPPPGRETITIGDRRRIKVEYIGNMDVLFHGKSGQRITLIDVAHVPDLGFNLYSLHAVQRTHLIVPDAFGTHIIGANLTFPRSSSGSYLRATRLPAGTVGARRRQGYMRVTFFLRQLGHPIPPPPQEISPRRNTFATGLHNSNVPGVVTVLEPTPFPPLSSVLGEVQFEHPPSMNALFHSEPPRAHPIAESHIYSHAIVVLTNERDRILWYAKTGEYCPEEGSINQVVRFGKVDKT